MIRLFLQKLLTGKAFGKIVYTVVDWKNLNSTQRRDYVNGMKQLKRSRELTNELNKVRNSAIKSAVRTSSVNTELAFARGMIHAIEILEKRIEQVASIE